MQYTNFIGEPTIEKVIAENHVFVTRQYYALLHSDEWVHYDIIGVLSGVLLGRYEGYADAKLPSSGDWFGYPEEMSN